MTPPTPWVRPNLEQRLVLLLIGAVLTPVLAISLFGLAGGANGSVVAVAGVLVVDLLVFAPLLQRQVRRYREHADAKVAALTQQQAESERLASVGRVAACVAHEIGNPLTGIANYAHVLRGQTARTPDTSAAFTGIEREIDRIDRIVSTLLDYARPRRKSQPAPFDGAGALRQAVQLLSAQGVFRTVQVQSLIDASPLALVGSQHDVEQAFVNLLLNAIEAMESKGGTLSVYAGQLTPETILRSPRRSGDAATASSAERRVNPRLDAWRAHHKFNEPCAKFVVADSGPGVSADEADRIFDPFFTTKERDNGSGLGLAIVQRVVDSHDGVVWVQRAREGGAAFHIVLPLQGISSIEPSMVA